MKRFTAPLCALALFISGAQTPASAELIYGIAAVGNSTALLSWDSASPGSIISGSFVSGLQSNETIVGIDFRPATGGLYALGTSSRLYTLNTSTGAATAVAAPFSPALNGFNFGFDFNPTIDRIRVVAETNKNLVLNPITGAVQLAATDLAFGPGDPNFGIDPNVVNSAYTNNFAGATTTQLYGIDTALDILVTQANNAGTLGTVGPLGFNVTGVGGFDISGTTGIAYAALLLSGSSQSNLYTINLATGAATPVGQIDGGVIITAMTVAPAVPEPATLGLAAMALAAVPLARRRK
ncbi:DUF4394 domain-containing protein [Lacipirellula parvula]|uniref:DUF4394 domain-containing protein n=1 Tax=Lacipirellula parvula TaxID=2650471 RepID=A0A5K7XJW0_9BACT|nr:DUF4394 domain-containing protein [Lacipirellula parvula]BBO36422.1 hypothetical protein PLANPX_6034 [Lacipirellula parvula]